MSRLVSCCIVALLVAALPVSAAGRRAPGEVRSARQLVERVQELSAHGTVLACLVEDAGAEPGVRLGTYAPTRKVTVSHAALLRVVDGAVARQALPAGSTPVLFPDSLGTDRPRHHPETPRAMLVVAQRVGNTWVAFPEWSSPLAPRLLAP